jgi:hypothetical protein
MTGPTSASNRDRAGAGLFAWAVVGARLAAGFADGVLKLPLPWSAWTLAMITLNLAGALYFLGRIEGQVVLAVFVPTAGLMMYLYASRGFTRILGAGHVLWLALLPWLAHRLEQAEPGSWLAAWILALLAVNGTSLLIDAVDVVRYLRGDRRPMTKSQETAPLPASAVPSARITGQIVDDRTVRTLVAGTVLDQMGQGAAHGPQFVQLGVDLDEMLLSDQLDLGAGPALVLIKRQKRPAVADREAQAARPLHESELVQQIVGIIAVAVLGSLGDDQIDIFVIADGFGRQAGGPGRISDVHAHPSSRAPRRRKALPITETELRLMAAAAIIGFSRMPKNG